MVSMKNNRMACSAYGMVETWMKCKECFEVFVVTAVDMVAEHVCPACGGLAVKLPSKYNGRIAAV